MTRTPLTLSAHDLLDHRFDTIIDTRSPAEFAEDHVPGAINCPVLNDTERAEIGTLYKQVSPFEARKRGAVLTARNIAAAIEAHFLDRPKNWSPLIYCWRGGQRSGAMQIIFREIGWPAMRIEGGYKAYRQTVLDALGTLPAQFKYVVIGGPTGSGKTRLLHKLHEAGAQVIDLEAMARHKGSVLGRMENHLPQSRKMFDTQLVSALRSFNPAKPVYIEAESRRIGIIHLPPALCTAMHDAPCIYLDPPIEARIDFLVADYATLINDPVSLTERLQTLKELQGKETIAHWVSLVAASDWTTLTRELLTKHYDPLYHRSAARWFPNMMHAPRMTPQKLNDQTLADLAVQIICSTSAT